MFHLIKSVKRSCAIPALAIMLSLPAVLFAGTAHAQCENSFTATSTFNQMAQDIAQDLNDFIEQEENFIEDKITTTAKDEVITRLEEFDQNIRNGLSTWWREHFEPALKSMTTQLHASQVDQTRVLGSMVDAQAQNEFMQDMQRREVQAQYRYAANELTCQIDTAAQGQTRATRTARAAASAMARQSVPKRMNASGTAGVRGQGAEQRERWVEYTTRFCDPDKGGQGCGGTTGDLAGRHVDLPRLLWADKQTLDMTSPDNIVVVEGVMKYMLSPKVSKPIPREMIDSPAGQQAMLEQRTLTARQNVIYNAVAMMIGQRMGGSGVNTQDMRVAAGLPPAEASTDASYAEIMQAVTKDRFHNPEYIVRLVQSPEQVVREQGAVNAVRLQQLNDFYKRTEDMVFLEAAAYAAQLDKRIPKPQATALPIRP
ncbi:MAG: hypothetical protein RBS08_05590 [Bdellovibrionales bacterium]|jgi:hypothetical protein|nr:hypothetical protein [Bdellovibrionales bacterium]